MVTIEDEAIKPFFIEVTESQYTLRKNVTTKGGKPAVETTGYFTQLDTVLQRIARLMLVDAGGKKSLLDFVTDFQVKLRVVKAAIAPAGL